MGSLLAPACALAMLLLPVPLAGAEPIALLDAPRATDVALAGPDVLVARGTPGRGVRVDAVPRAGGPVRPLLALRAPRGGAVFVRLAASPERVAAQTILETDSGPVEFRLYDGPPGGPLGLRARVRWSGGPAWMPFDVDVDGDRVLVSELRRPRIALRARVLSPDGTSEPVPWPGSLLTPAVLAGDRVAFVGSTRRGPRARVNGVYVVDRRSGAVEATLDLRGSDDVEDRDLDMAPDGRVVAAVDGSLRSVAPGVAPAAIARDGFTAPRFAGDALAALHDGRFSARRPVVVDAGGGPPRALGGPSAAVEAFAADALGVAWVANGCVLHAALAGAPPAEPPPGPCPRAEVALEEGDQTLRGRRLEVSAACVAAPADGCRGTVLLRAGRTVGRGSFHVAPGARRRVEVALTAAGVRRVRRAMRREGVAFLGLRARVRDGRAHGTSGVLVARVRPR